MARAKTAEIVPFNASVEETVERIWTAFRDHTLPGIFKMGEALKVEKARLTKERAWMAMFEDHDMPFSLRTAERLIAIADCSLIRNSTHVSSLPAHWGTLYALTTLTEEQFAKGIKSGVINTKMERKDVASLLPRRKPKKKKRVVTDGGDDEIPTQEEVDAEWQDSMFDQACGFMKEMTRETRQRFFAHIEKEYGNE